MKKRSSRIPHIAPLQRVVGEWIRVLVVESDQSLRSQMVDHLNDNGFQSVGADSAASAVAYLQERWHDVVVLDPGICNHSGDADEAVLDVLREVARRERKASVLILADSAALSDRLAALELGAVAYFEKGQNMDQLHQHVYQVWLRHPRDPALGKLG